MLVVFLVILAFGSGCTLTYFLMDSSRKRALKVLAEISAREQLIQDEKYRLSAERNQIDIMRQNLNVATDDHNRKVTTFQAEVALFDNKKISYNELEAENRILKADIKGEIVNKSHLESSVQLLKQEVLKLTTIRNRLGTDLLYEQNSNIQRTLTPGNYPNSKQRLEKVIDKLSRDGYKIPISEKAKLLSDLHSQYELSVRAAVERERQASMREQIREEQRREKEAREEIERTEREKMAIEEALRKALADASGKHAEEVDRLREQLAEAEARVTRAVSMAEITKVGNVYVISNVGSFGKDVYKIGMTRRLEPLDRIYELGDASVPFPFDVHMMIKCDDAPKLESALHRHFHTRRVNRVNPRKEFFRTTVSEIAAFVKENHGDVEYKADAEALEFHQSQTMTDQDLKEVEDAFAKAEDILEKSPDESGIIDE